MGEVSPLKIGVPRPRPLGLVKRESIHFEDVESTSGLGLPFPGKNLSWTPGTLVELGRSKTEGDIKRDLKSMRDLQETLRQAALLNIVAAVNHEERPVESLPPTRAAGSQSVGIKGASILGHTIPAPANRLLVASSSNEGVNNIGHFSHNLQSSAATGLQTMPPGSQQSTINQILAQRTRTISIPRPRTQNDQGAFMHKSLLDAKEKLTGVTTFRAGFKKEFENQTIPTSLPPQPVQQIDEVTETKQPVIVETNNKELVRTVSCIRGTGIDSNDSGNHEKPTKDNGQNNNQNGDSSGTQNSMTKDEQRAHNVHQMQVVKRHISTSKKKELMKKLTEIAKCEAVDMAVPLSSNDPNTAPPIIIMSQQKDYSPIFGDLQDTSTRVNRTKSMTSLNGNGDESRVPSNTRVQSETIDAMFNHRESKKKAPLNLDEDLRIESLNGNDRRNIGVDGLYRTNRESKMSNFDAFTNHNSNPLSQEPFFTENISGKQMQPSFSPDFLELRPLAESPIIQNRVVLSERRRAPFSRRFVVQHGRDKLISPSPVVYEASFHRPKASMGQVSLVGQSVQSVAESKSNKPLNKPQKQKSEGTPLSPQAGNKTEETSKKTWGDPKAMSLKHWGSIAKPTSTKSPILRTEILDHLQCVGLVNNRQPTNFYKRHDFKGSGTINAYNDLDRSEDEFYNDDDDDDDDNSSDTPRALKNTPQYRKSKLYNAFRASEENLSTLVDSSLHATETMTGRSMFNQQLASTTTDPKDTTPPSSRDPANIASKEPLYMGCSSRVSENDLRSQFHYVSEADEKDAHRGANFKVMKAIDQDVYFDFQHKKYRKNNDSPLNTAADKPRVHFLKIKFNGEAKT